MITRLLFVLFLCFAQSIAVSAMVGSKRGEVSAEWQKLMPEQKATLAPLQNEWAAFTLSQRREWLRIASRYPKLKLEEQQRLQARMTEWSRMTRTERRIARKNFQASRTLPPQNKAQAWQIYQSLPEKHKKALAKNANTKPPTIVSASPTQPASPQLAAMAQRKRLARMPAPQQPTLGSQPHTQADHNYSLPPQKAISRE